MANESEPGGFFNSPPCTCRQNKGENMASKTWDGSTASFFDSTHWNPAGVPQAGDEAIIESGTVTVPHRMLDSLGIALGSHNPSGAATLSLRNANLGSGLHIGVLDPTYNGDIQPFPKPTTTATIDVKGFVKDAGSIDVGGSLSSNYNSNAGFLTLNLAQNSVFDLTGSIRVNPSGTLHVEGDKNTALINSGTISAVSPMTVGVPVFGNGKFDLEFGRSSSGSTEFASFVAPGQAITLGTMTSLTLDQPRSFLGSISEAPLSVLTLENTHTTSNAYENGVLTIFDNLVPVANLRITSTTNAGFNVANQGSNVVITTPFPSTAASVLTADQPQPLSSAVLLSNS
jgi:hypothetical protein